MSKEESKDNAKDNGTNEAQDKENVQNSHKANDKVEGNKKAKDKEKDEGIVRQDVEMVATEVPLGSLMIEAETFSFREDGDLSDKSLESLAANIAVNGLTTPPLGVKKGTKVLVTDGHRRFSAMMLLVRKGTRGWSLDRPVRVVIMPADTSKVEILARAISSNIQKQPFSGLGRALAAAALHHEGMPPAQIAGMFGVNVKTIDRDLSVASVPRAMGLVRDTHAIPFSSLATLVPKAQKAGRLTELFDAIDDFATWARGECRKKNAELRVAGDAELTGEKVWPQRKLTKARIAAWEKALSKETAFDQAETVNFSASVQREGGVQRIKVSAINMIVAEASLEDIKTVFERTTRFQKALKKALRDRGNQERLEAPESSDDDGMVDELQAEYESLGIADLVKPNVPETDGEDDPDFGETTERAETDELDEGDADELDEGESDTVDDDNEEETDTE